MLHRLHRPHGAVRHLGHLFEGEVGHEAQQHDLALLVGQGGERFDEVLVHRVIGAGGGALVVEAIGEGSHAIVENGVRLMHYRPAKLPSYGRAASFIQPDRNFVRQGEWASDAIDRLCPFRPKPCCPAYRAEWIPGSPFNASMTSPESSATVGSRVSLIALSDLGALSLSGVQWPLDKRHVLFGSTLTLSNVVLGPAEVTLESGHGVIVAYPAE